MPTYPLRTTPLYAVEYPGPVHSVPAALESLGGINTVSSSLLDDSKQLDLNLVPGNPYGHNVVASQGGSGNVVLRVVKRRRKKRRIVDGVETEEGLFEVKVVGVTAKTLRFRNMADFQFLPDLKDDILQFADKFRSMDLAAIKGFDFPPHDEDAEEYQYLPPPVFSRSAIHQTYDYKANPTSIVQSRVLADGEEVHRLINKDRHNARSLMTLSSLAAEVPTSYAGKNAAKPTAGGQPPPPLQRGKIDEKLRELIEERPVWLRGALMNKFEAEERQVIINKHVLPDYFYTFNEGPYRDLLCRYGFDPRADNSSRFYVCISFRNKENERSRGAAPERDPLSHIFDGKVVHGKLGSYQLCDITDPILVQLIKNEEGVQGVHSPETGWWKHDYLEQIRLVLRRKWDGIQKGYEVTDKDVGDLLGDPREIIKIASSAARRKARDGTVAAAAAGGPGSGQEGSGASEGEGSGPKAKATQKIARAPWESGKNKRHRGAKKRSDKETLEDVAARLKRSMSMATKGKGKGRKSKSVTGSAGSGSGDGDGSGDDDLEDGTSGEDGDEDEDDEDGDLDDL